MGSGNIFANIQWPKWPDLEKERIQAEALKHAEQQRKLQAAQTLMEMAKFKRDQENWQRQDAFQAAMGNIGQKLTDPETGLLHPEAASTLMRIDAPKTLALNKTIADQVKAKLESDARAKEALQKDQQLALHDIDSAMLMPDEQKRLEYVMQNWERYRKLNVLTPDEHEELALTGLTVPLHDRMATRLLGQEKFNEYQKKALELADLQKKSKAEDLTRQAETTKKILESEAVQSKAAAVHLEAARKTGNQDAWTKARNEVPEKDRGRVPEKLDPNFDPLELGMSPAEIAASRERGMPDNAKKLIIRMNQPDVTPEQRESYAKQLEQMLQYDVKVAEAAAGAKPMSAEASKVSAIAESLVPEARLLQEAIRKGGRNAILAIMMKTDPKLSRLADNVADKLGRMRSGGAVNVSEEARFMSQLARWADLLQSSNDMSAPTEAIDRIIEEANMVFNRMQPGQNKPAAVQPQANTQATPRGPAPSPLLKPGSVVVRTPDGAFTFPNQAEADAFKKKAGLK